MISYVYIQLTYMYSVMHIQCHVHAHTINIVQLVVPKVENPEVVLGPAAKLGDAFEVVETKVKEGHTVYTL